jgi:hypothetical protein
MNCPKCKEYLDDYIRGFLPPEESNQVRLHLELCSACNGEYESITALFGFLDKEPPLGVTSGELVNFMPEIWSKIETAKKPRFSWVGRMIPIVSTVLILSVVVFRPNLQSFRIAEPNEDYEQVAAVYDSNQYNQSTYKGLLQSLFADDNVQVLEIAESELAVNTEILFTGSLINELDNFTDEGLEVINQKLSELRGTEG